MTQSKLIEINSSDLPAGWSVSSIGQISLYIQRGKSPAYAENSDLPVVNQKCVRWDGIERRYLKFIHPSQFEKWSSERFLVNGDILWNSTGTGTIGRAALVQISNDERMVADSHITIIRPSNNVFAKYIHYWIMSSAVQNSIGEVQSGSTNQVELSKRAVESTPIPLAPLDQQKLIVSKIEELFSHIDTGIEGLKKTRAKLQQYRKSVLKDAVTGKLTEKWREQNFDKLEPAEKMLERILNERRSSWERKQIQLHEIKGWKLKENNWHTKYIGPKSINFEGERHFSHLIVTLEHISFYSIYGPRFSSEQYAEDGAIVLRTTDIDEHGRVNFQKAPKINLTENEFKKYRVDKGDFLITRTGSIGTLAIYNDEYDAIPGAYLLHYKLLTRSVNSLYIYFVFKSPQVQKELSNSTTGIGIQNLNAPNLEKIEFILPSIDEQNEIVSLVSEKLRHVEKCQSDIESLIKKAHLQRQSVLAKAFSGELVANESTQTALELLEKINAEKQLLLKKAKSKTTSATKKGKKVTTERKSIKFVLKTIKKPVSPEELMQLADFSAEEVEEFYIELAALSEQLERVVPTKEQLKSWPYEKYATLKLKLKDSA